MAKYDTIRKKNTPNYLSQDGENGSVLICVTKLDILGVQLCFRRFPIDGFSGKWWSK